MIFDTHAHYDDTAFDPDREELLAVLPSCGIGHVVNASSDLASSKRSLALAEAYPFIHAAVGIHPDEVGKAGGETAATDEKILAALEQMTRHPKCVAIGEIGLDYHGYDIYEDKPSKELQKHWFWLQLSLAARQQLPVIIHSRNAAADTLSVMQRARRELNICRAVIHCFSYSKEQALAYLELGYALGFGGSVTYEGQKKITKVLEAVPLDRILLETDCPYLTPLPKRGQRNDSRNLPFVVQKIADIKGISAGEVIRATWENACRFYLQCNSSHSRKPEED